MLRRAEHCSEARPLAGLALVGPTVPRVRTNGEKFSASDLGTAPRAKVRPIELRPSPCKHSARHASAVRFRRRLTSPVLSAPPSPVAETAPSHCGVAHPSALSAKCDRDDDPARRRRRTRASRTERSSTNRRHRACSGGPSAAARRLAARRPKAPLSLRSREGLPGSAHFTQPSEPRNRDSSRRPFS
jgi:hypothetical protein